MPYVMSFRREEMLSTEHECPQNGLSENSSTKKNQQLTRLGSFRLLSPLRIGYAAVA
jgi:hypothetical protein